MYGKLENAITEYERWLAFDSDAKNHHLINPKNYYLLAKLYEQKG